MQTLKATTLVFCFACIMAEALSQTVGGAGAQKCIKAVAGLYILVSVLHAVQGVTPSALALPDGFDAGGVDAQSYGQAILDETAARLAQTLEQALAQRDCPAAVNVTLSQQGGSVSVLGVTVTPRAPLTPQKEAAARQYLEEQLGTENVTFLEEERADDEETG